MHRFDEALGCAKADVVGGSWHSGSDIAMSMQCTARLSEAFSCSQRDVCNTVYGEAKYPAAAGALYVGEGWSGCKREEHEDERSDIRRGPLLLIHRNGVSKRTGSRCRKDETRQQESAVRPGEATVQAAMTHEQTR